MQMKNQPQIVLINAACHDDPGADRECSFDHDDCPRAWSWLVTGSDVAALTAGEPARGCKTNAGSIRCLRVWGLSWACSFVVQAHVMDTGGKGNVDIKLPSSWSCLLASVGAGIREEVWLRLGLMTFFAWAITRLRAHGARLGSRLGCKRGRISRLRSDSPSSSVCISEHKRITFIFVLIGNGVPGVVFGWLFWQKGLIAAMLSHTFFDIVTKVVYPLFIG